MIFIEAILILILVPVSLIVVGVVWLWLGHKILAYIFGC
ncbi:hypothetical protein SAMN05446927_4282 [Caballeronia arationis]|uniref:Uncharacterized protein n=1 Tax=Caballeronia arationis TaxID=1777142 RepID=A0A7Z7N4E8_9BURK|nr:hypothetical protein SAMN05446927_4282 [Caballeronia arationis]